MSAYKIQTAGNYPEENIQHTEHSKSLKSRILQNIWPDKMMNEQKVHGCNIWEIYAPHRATQHNDVHLSAHFALSELTNLRDSAQMNRMPCLTTCSLPSFTLAQFQLTTLACKKNRNKIPLVTTYDQNLLLVLFLLWSLTLRQLMSYIYGAPILDVSRSHTTTQHSR